MLLTRLIVVSVKTFGTLISVVCLLVPLLAAANLRARRECPSMRLTNPRLLSPPM